MVNARFMPKVFYLRELVSWCAHRFDPKRKTIQAALEGKNHVLLTPKTFKRMLRLPTSNKSFKLPEPDSFMDSQGGGANLLKDFIVPFVEMSSDLSSIEISLLAKPYRDFA